MIPSSRCVSCGSPAAYKGSSVGSRYCREAGLGHVIRRKVLALDASLAPLSETFDLPAIARNMPCAHDGILNGKQCGQRSSTSTGRLAEAAVAAASGQWEIIL